jgi:hypothetical protein
MEQVLLYRSCTASFELKDLKTRGDLGVNEADHFRYADFSLLFLLEPSEIRKINKTDNFFLVRLPIQSPGC